MTSRNETLKILEKYYKNKAKGKQKERVKDFLKLYKDGKIFSKVTIQREINRYLGQSFKSEGERDLFYYKTMTKYLDNPTAVLRKEKIRNEPEYKKVSRKADREQLKRERAERRKIRNGIKNGTLRYYTVSTIVYSGSKQTPDQKPKYIYKQVDALTGEVEKIPVYTLTIRNFNVLASNPFPNDIHREFLSSYPEHKELYEKVMNILETDKYFDEHYGRYGDTYRLDAVYIMNAEPIPSKGKYKPLDTPLRNQEKVSIYHKYIETPVNLEYETLREAIENKNYVENECWLNAITEHYKESLLSKKRNPITRETILNIINKTEDNIKDGITINEILPFFEKYGIQLRVIDYMYNCIAKHEPEVRSHHYKALYCMIKGDHIYTFNYDIKSLQQLQLEKKTKVILPVSANYYTREKQEVQTHKMIDNLNDILKILKTFDNKKAENVYLVLRDDNLLKLLFDLFEAGYEPKIKHEAGKLTLIVFKLKKITFYVKTQQLRPESMDGEISVNTEEKYNNMSKAMIDFNKALMKSDYKSFYTSQDIDYLDCYRTIVPSGVFKKCECDCSEIDISKAFTSSLSVFDTIPIFNEFDNWKVYNNTYNIKELSLYKVKSNKINLFFNKRYNIVYGKYLKYFLDDVDILEYKDPAFIKEVQYGDIVKELFEKN